MTQGFYRGLVGVVKSYWGKRCSGCQKHRPWLMYLEHTSKRDRQLLTYAYVLPLWGSPSGKVKASVPDGVPPEDEHALLRLASLPWEGVGVCRAAQRLVKTPCARMMHGLCGLLVQGLPGFM